MDSILSAHEYKAEIAAVVCRAADKGIITRHVPDPGRGLRLADLADIREARTVVHMLCVAPDRYVRPLWLTVDGLQPEIGACIVWARRMASAEQMIERGMVILRELQDKTSAGSPGQEGASAADRRDKWPQPLVT